MSSSSLDHKEETTNSNNGVEEPSSLDLYIPIGNEKKEEDQQHEGHTTNNLNGQSQISSPTNEFLELALKQQERSFKSTLDSTFNEFQSNINTLKQHHDTTFLDLQTRWNEMSDSVRNTNHKLADVETRLNRIQTVCDQERTLLSKNFEGLKTEVLQTNQEVSNFKTGFAIQLQELNDSCNQRFDSQLNSTNHWTHELHQKNEDHQSKWNTRNNEMSKQMEFLQDLLQQSSQQISKLHRIQWILICVIVLLFALVIHPILFDFHSEMSTLEQSKEISNLPQVRTKPKTTKSVAIYRFGNGLDFDFDTQLLQFISQYSEDYTLVSATDATKTKLNVVLVKISSDRLQESFPTHSFHLEMDSKLSGKPTLLIVVRLTQSVDVYSIHGLDEFVKKNNLASTAAELNYDMQSEKFKEVLFGNLKQKLMSFLSK
ncbi:hypothetical protein C9374_009932 [Naegleria lovaniensis]|uniref:Uncharacterized protein n=1 Tax=Naegleria lovaniensis TaxID=51637 RepID=A0AA88GHD8_NAELO|nr:uncharacterized protein C9374_009932 [Naegleria lovaniensis]KAG2375309.1 hypothetical protein C9374_009932 [Naegleria lovaniensis]